MSRKLRMCEVTRPTRPRPSPSSASDCRLPATPDLDASGSDRASPSDGRSGETSRSRRGDGARTRQRDGHGAERDEISASWFFE